MNIKLYGFRICPYVERINILINEHKLNIPKEEINIRNKPSWFAEQVPSGKVPALVVNDRVIFESTVILDYLDAFSQNKSLYPEDLLLKHYSKSWIEFGSQIITDNYNLILARDYATLNNQKKMVENKLFILQKEIQHSPFFFGQDFTMLDLTYAPLFKRMDCLSRLYQVDLLSDFPLISSWAAHILKRDSVKNAFASNFEEEFSILLTIKESVLAET